MDGWLIIAGNIIKIIKLKNGPFFRNKRCFPHLQIIMPSASVSLVPLKLGLFCAEDTGETPAPVGGRSLTCYKILRRKNFYFQKVKIVL
ncbi:hypothetical protein A7A78_08845 [Aequorivita soesokkakensis]|uniref:Uncharacterized protein n=1 Tax=Aequorivita soesokkakensis TaxID=1385699 RepID=A0A1A9LI15_9FLAO|nr:hypothetical protein A7A78_08845 [Aequorivita soesokkakensis]